MNLRGYGKRQNYPEKNLMTLSARYPQSFSKSFSLFLTVSSSLRQFLKMLNDLYAIYGLHIWQGLYPAQTASSRELKFSVQLLQL